MNLILTLRAKKLKKLSHRCWSDF